MQKIICTICSREKAEDPAPLPACVRYKGAHIRFVHERARAMRCPFYIVSGAYGLLAEQEGVGYYDYKLDTWGVGRLANRISAQLDKMPIAVSQIELYAKDKPAWKPYIAALELAALKRNILVRVVWLSDTV